MRNRTSYNKIFIIYFFILFLTTCSLNTLSQQREIRKSILPKPLIDEKLMDILINEVSGEMQLNNEKLLAAFNHNRTKEEYEKVFYESTCLLNKLKEYGIEEAAIEDVPNLMPGKTWDAISAELWMVEPEKKKLTCLEDMPPCLCSGSETSDVTAELVYVGPGSSMKYYEGKNVKDKIVLVAGSPFRAHSIAVYQLGAKGVVAYSSSHPEHDPDQVGWNGIGGFFGPSAPEGKKPTFGFMVSTRMGEELRRMLEQGEKIVLHAQCETTYYPTRNEVVWALIKGSEKPEEELIFTAHLFEGMAKQGANDNVSGSVSLLETARVITKLIKEGKIPPPKRSIRFLWINEIIGTLAYIQKYPELAKRWFANINEDMVGEGLIKNLASFHIYTTPYSIPSYLNDVMTNFIEYVGETNRDNIINRPVKFVKPILSPAGSKDPFYYNIEKFYGSSDHMVFVDGGIGIPGIMLIAWPDMWYHTDGDRPDKSDSTQLKRVSVIDTAAAIYLTKAGKKEAIQMVGEILTRGASRIAEDERRAYAYLMKSKAEELPEVYKEAKNIIHQAYLREEVTLRSTAFFTSADSEYTSYLDNVCNNLLAQERLSMEALSEHYKNIAALQGVEPVSPKLTAEEKRLDQLIPKRTENMAGLLNYFTFHMSLRGKKDLPEYHLKGLEDFEIRNFIDNKRSILEIRNAVSAEFRSIPLKDVENYIKVLELGGMVTIEKKNK
jgi:aminopeptidase YwaD